MSASRGNIISQWREVIKSAKKPFDPYHVYMKDAAAFLGITTRTLMKYDGKYFKAARDAANRRHFTMVELFLIYRKVYKKNPPGQFIVDFLTERGVSHLRTISIVNQMQNALVQERE